MADASRNDLLMESLRTLSHFFVGGGTMQETLDRVAHLASEAVDPAAMAGITMGVEGRARTAVYTDDDVAEIDQAQYDTGVGPCLEAYRTRQPYVIADTEKDDRWLPFSEAAAARGIRSTLSLPLVAADEGLGALNFYSKTPNAFSDEHLETGRAFATQAAVVLANAQAYWDAKTLGEQLTYAMQSRAVIEQAKGIIMATGKTADEAFQILVRASQRENRKLNQIAAEVVAGVVSRKPPPAGSG